MNHKYT